jgi:hypothetical protein
MRKSPMSNYHSVSDATCDNNHYMEMAASRTRMTRMGLLCIVACAALLVGCSKPYKQKNVWDQYDIRVPVPQNSPVPSAAPLYQQYNDPYRLDYGTQPQDNDVYYMPPVLDINSETYD